VETSIRPWYTTGIALVGASAIALAPISPSAPTLDVRAAATAAMSTVSTEFQLAALDLPYILTLPILRQQFVNWAQNWAVYLAGLGKAGVGLVDSLVAIPGVTAEIIQQVLALDFVGAFDTFTSAARNAVIAVGQPLLDSLIWRNQKFYAVETALQAAVPKAFIDVVNGFLVAGNVVTTSLIVGTQDFIGALLTLNLSNIINAALDGTKNFVTALGAGAGAIVDGIESAQFGIATALATPPPPVPTVAEVSSLRTLSVERTISVPSSSSAEELSPAAEEPVGQSAPSVVEDKTTPAAEETTVEKPKVVDAGAEVHDAPKPPAAGDVSDDADDPTEPATPPKKSADDTVKKATPGAAKDAGAKDSSAKHEPKAKDSGTDPKPSSDPGDS
jgi:hypothetical protein